MSGPGTSTGRQPKVMSNRLMTMKFMQRGASNTSPQSPDAPSPSFSTPSSSKRQKLSHTPTSGPSTPGTPIATISDAAVARTALAAEEAKRSAALEKLRIESGETKWVLSYFERKPVKAGIQIVEYGKEERDDSDQGDTTSRPEVVPWREEQSTGRMKFGTWKAPQEEKPSDASGSSDETGDDSAESEAETDARTDTGNPIDPEAVERARRKRKAKKKAEMKEREKLAKMRKSKEINLNGRPSYKRHHRPKPEKT